MSTNSIGRQELNRRIEQGESLILVEALGAEYFDDAHLPGAINLPPGQVDRLAADLLPDLEAEIFVYCSGTCENSQITALRLIQLGYENVWVYEGGKEDWIEHQLPIERSAGTTELGGVK